MHCQDHAVRSTGDRALLPLGMATPASGGSKCIAVKAAADPNCTCWQDHMGRPPGIVVWHNPPTSETCKSPHPRWRWWYTGLQPQGCHSSAFSQLASRPSLHIRRSHNSQARDRSVPAGRIRHPLATGHRGHPLCADHTWNSALHDHGISSSSGGCKLRWHGACTTQARRRC